MANRMMISQESQPIPCEDCGQPTLHVARLVAGDGQLLGQTMVCTECHRRRNENGSGVTT
ncbi:hypothetical protein [Amycolatopsis sp. FDAARGOS 1241]|uniref:hypothetical protein n=1 Tax=Amycolatopsis sp. FDAARGOS 1241 TaxID=2778070 RepID=UPI0019515318|nr:hypothetical protein [Amycolatopsis sp. FDAARGOS 1241]QRP49715.1 hypothetical protein I6J71_19420 [Amycolatopsis sp. FDAARGOS 1241]